MYILTYLLYQALEKITDEDAKLDIEKDILIWYGIRNAQRYYKQDETPPKSLAELQESLPRILIN